MGTEATPLEPAQKVKTCNDADGISVYHEHAIMIASLGLDGKCKEKC